MLSVIPGTTRVNTITSDVIHGTHADIYGESDDIFGDSDSSDCKRAMSLLCSLPLFCTLMLALCS
jgi:hypothetical protein